MKLGADQLAILSKLSDQWLDLPEAQRSRWRDEAIRQYPELAIPIAAMADDSAESRVSPELNHTLADREDEAPEFAQGDNIGSYRLVREIGRGGMGVVWLADQDNDHITRTVALKLPLQHLAQRGLRTRFARERNILAALDHPGIAKMFDAGVSADGQPYMAMQYVSGVAITSHCDQRQLDVAARLQLFIELLDAVQYAHSNLIVHRDLKPGNILVTTEGRVMLLDFGIAKLLDAQATADPTSNGKSVTEFAGTALTLDYASPEQVADQVVSTRSDIYSLGVVLYELLVGRRPYHLRRASRAALEEAVLEQDIKSPSSRVDDVSATRYGGGRRALAKTLRGDLDAIVLKALGKTPESRYATAQSFADDLQRWLRKKPVSAQPDKLGYRTRRLLARRWPLILATTAMSLIVLTTAAVAVVQAIEARRASQAAQDETRKALAVTAFLKDLFKNNGADQADPAAARKRTAEQLLDDGARRIQQSLSDAPEQQIELMHLIFLMFREMRLSDRALEVAEQTALVAQKAYGATDPRTLAEVARLARTAYEFNETDVGARTLALVEPELTRMAASENIELRRAAAMVVDAQLATNIFFKVRESLRNGRQGEQIYATLPTAEFDYGRHHILGVAYFKNLLLKEAEKHFIESARLAAKFGNWPESHPAWYAQLLAMTGRYGDADAQFRTAHALERHHDAGTSRIDVWVLCFYARFLIDTARASDALALIETRGPDASVPMREALQLASLALRVKSEALVRLGRIEEGLAVSERGAQRTNAEWGELAALVVPAAKILALLELGRLDDAQGLLDGTVKILERLETDASTEGRLYWRYRVTFLVAQGHTAQARAVLERSRSILSPPGAGLAELAMVDWLDAAVEQQEGKHASAKDRLQLALAQIAKSPDRLWLREWEAKLQESLGVSLLALGDTAAAQHSLEQALELYKQVLDPKTSLHVGRVALRLANLHKQAGRVSLAKPLQAQSDAIRRKHPMFEQWIL